MNASTVVRPSAFQSPIRKMRLLLANLPFFAGLLSESGRVLECNFGPLGTLADNRIDWVGRAFETGPWWNYSEESRADILIMLGRARTGDRVSKERLYKNSQGHMGVMILTLTPLFAPYGQPDAILVTAMDVTERRRESNAVDHIAYDMAHRLRNSFTMMRTLATRAGDETPDPDAILSHRLSQIRASHNLTYQYLFFDVPIEDIIAIAIKDKDQLSHYDYEPVSIPSDLVEALVFALAELARPGFSAELTAKRLGDDQLSLTWTEPAPRMGADMPSGLTDVLLKAIPEQKSGGCVVIDNDQAQFTWAFEFSIKPKQNSDDSR